MDLSICIKSAKRNLLIVAIAIAASVFVNTIAHAQTPAQWEEMKGDINLFLANDLGRNGYYDQKPIAAMMGEMAETVGPEAILALGDVHHFGGVRSVSDPLWMTNYELIYSHPELMCEWLPILGNHEYRGNTQTVLDYGKVSVRIVMIDTTPMIDRYHNSPTYPDVDSQDVEAQLAWIDATLDNAKEDWVIVVGHHPVYAQTGKDVIEQQDMQRNLLPILRKYSKKVDMYVCGHIHNFQHIRRGNDGIDFVVNSAGSLARKVEPTEGTVFCSPEPGFSVVSATKQQLNLYMIDKTGNVIHKIEKTSKRGS